MSQQHMQYDPEVSAEPTPYVSGYQEGSPRTQNYPASSYGQKLVIGHTGALDISVGQRLALAIVSLAFFIVLVLFFVVVGIAINISEGNLGPFLGALFGVLSLYSVVAILINVVFNRRH